ncbi:MAG: proprotein convertase P-domain-containing protein [Chloracidobacterium sp.]|nr:proprotein convertase P-domain-containing protein [Chloracidobacterium sp.]
MNISAFGAAGSRLDFLHSTTVFLGLDSGITPVFSNSQETVNEKRVLGTSLSSSAVAVTVTLPVVNATPGVVVIPITVGDVTGLGVISFDFQIDFNSAIIQPASPPTDGVGTLSSSMSITPNSNNPGHLIISAFQGASLIGSGTLINLRFNVVGTAGQSTGLAFADYTNPQGGFHPAFMFNEGDPKATITNGSVTIPGGSTPTNTATNTPTAAATSTFTSTPTNTATNTPSNTATNTPTRTSTNTPTSTATNTATPTNTSTAGATATNTSTNTPTAAATATSTGTPSCGTTASYTGPAVAITDNVPAGINFTIPVSGVGTVSDLNFRFDGTQSADPASTTPGLNHSWVGDIVVRITSPGGTTVAAYDRPGVPATTFGCASNNLAQLTLDDDGGFPSIETQCGADTNAAFPTGTFAPDNPLSAFDGQNADGNWVINISDNAGGDTGSARAFSLVFGGACGTPTATSTGTPAATATSTSTVAATATATATATPTGSPSGELLVIDATTTNRITITATSGVSAATISGSTTTGFYFQNMFANAGTFVFGTTTLVSGNLTAASVPTDNTPALFRLNNTDPGLNVFSYSATATTTFTAGQLAFTGAGTWTITPAAYAALLTAPASGNIYFPADDAADLPTAVVLGTYRVILPGGATPTATSTGTPAATATSTVAATATSTSTAGATATSTATCVPAGTPVVLYDQSGNATTQGTGSQDFETASDSFDNRTADDFVVPVGQTWTVQRVVATGIYFNGFGPVDSFNVTFYNDAATFPGSAVAGGTFTGATYTNAADVFTITLPSNVVLTPGTYWVSVQARMDFTPGGQWGWIDRATTTNAAAVWQNPGGGFNIPACTSYARRGATCGIDAAAPDQVFQIVGTTGGGGGCATPTATSTGTPAATATATSTSTVAATATATGTGTPSCGTTASYTGPAVAITDNVPAGTNFTIPVSGVGTVSDLNFRFDGTQSADPASTTPGLNHSWVGDIVVRITSPGGTTVAAYDRPGVPATTFGCASNNLAQLSLDDDGGLPSIETQCGTDTNAAFPTGTFAPNNPLSAFDGQNANGNWVINISDNAGGDTGSARAFSLVFGGACGTPTATSTGTPPPTSTNTATATNTATPTASPSCTPSERVADGTFEAGTPWPLWTVQTSTNFDTPMCNTALCGTGGGAAPPFAGDNWAWFGGVPAAETATMGQTVTIPAGTATLSFQMRIGTVVAPFTDTLVVTIDGTQIASFTEPATAEAAYTLRTFDVSAFANGGSHALLFTYTGPTTGTASFTVDNVSITSGCGPVGTPTATATGSPQATATATATATSTGTPSCGTTASYTGPAVAITDNVPAGTNFTIPVSGVGTVSDLNFRFDGTQSADPASTTPGLNHSWVGDIVVRITSPGGTTVAAYDRPGVPATTFGCASNNLAQLTLDDDGGFPSIETQCGTDTNAAFPTGTFAPNNPLSAFDGQNANGNWVINISDNAGGDTGSARAFSLVFGGACGSPTATSTSTSTPASTATATATGTPSGGVIQFSSATYTEDESQTATITITRSGSTTGTDSTSFSTSNGTATGGAACVANSGVDYVSVTNQTVTFNPGETSKTVNVTICPDGITEPNQTANLSLTGGNLGSPSAAVLTINDTATTYRNSQSIAINTGGAGAPYPSSITVAGGPPLVGSMRVTIYDYSNSIPDNTDVLLVSPNGTKFILMANAGGLTPQGPVTINFTDTAGQVLADNGPLNTGTFEPTTYGGALANFPAPAPANPYNLPGGSISGTGTQTLFGNFGGTDSNGTWSLYLRDRSVAGGGGAIAGGWGLEFLASTAANASISGRVMTADGAGIRNAKVVVTGNSLAEPLITSTGSFGWFNFDGLRTGETYVVTINSTRYTFSTPSQVVTLADNVNNADFIADPQE